MNQDFKNALWGTANTLRGSVDPSEYKYPVLGLIFLKYASEAFAARRKTLERAFSDPNDDLYLKDPEARVSFLEDRNYYVMENVLWVPERARWPFIQGNAKQPNIAVLLDEAMGLIEADNPKLDGLLPKVYVRTVLEQNTLGSLIDLVASINFDAKDGGDVLGMTAPVAPVACLSLASAMRCLTAAPPAISLSMARSATPTPGSWRQ